jgi:hypothetical protein
MKRSIAATTLIPVVLAIAACAAATRDLPVSYTGVTRDDVHAIEQLVSRRPDILKPLISIERTRAGCVRVYSGRWAKTGDVFDEFTAAKRGGSWVISSSIKRGPIIITY